MLETEVSTRAIFGGRDNADNVVFGWLLFTKPEHKVIMDPVESTRFLSELRRLFIVYSNKE